MKRIMWIALDKKNSIFAVWYKECVQPYAKWKAAVKHLGCVRIEKVNVQIP